MKNIVRLIFLTFTYLILFLTGLNAQRTDVKVDSLSSSTQISILTSAPWQGAVYSVFGHSAIRIKDPEKGIDEVFNYGVFDFDTPNFTWRFATGKTDYIVASLPAIDYLAEYWWKNVDIYEQVLNLLDSEKQKIWNFLQENIKPENRTYRYNEIFNNCTTKLTDIVEATIEGEIIYPQDQDPKTFREILSEYAYTKPWLNFSINLIFGSDADIIANSREKMFLPLNQVHTLDYSRIKRGNEDETVPLILNEQKIWIGAKYDNSENTFIKSPMFFGLLVLLLSIILSVYEIKRRRRAVIIRLFDFIMFFMVGFAGCIILFFMFTLHPFTFPNYNIFWLNPLALLFAFCLLFKSCSRAGYYYQYINIILLIAFITLHFLLPQKFDIAFFPFILAICLRSIMYIVSNKKYLRYG